MTPVALILPIVIPALLGALIFLIPSRWKSVIQIIALLAASALLFSAAALFAEKGLALSSPWLTGIVDFDLLLTPLGAFILLSIATTGFLIAVYSLVTIRNHPRIREYYGYILFTLACASGSVLADNFVVFLFFWESLLLFLYGLISLGKPNAPRTALKAFLISAFCDFCLILGIAILWSVAGTAKMSDLSVDPSGLAAASFLLMTIGAVGKGGAIPFHTWIPDAAIDAPVSVMAFLPGALEKLLGIYLLARICLDFFVLEAGSALGIVLMAVGAVTIVLAVLMALIQKDLKKLLAFHAISQVGYMVLGIGTGTPIGIAGGIFHMVNNAIYKCGLFLGAGSVERRTGTTELKKLGGLYKEMPFTAVGFGVCALAISGIWPLNGFVSKEMIFHGSLEAGYTIFAVAAWVGAIFTFASFLKAGHSVFLGSKGEGLPGVKDSEATMVLPILALAFLSILFGIFNALPLRTFIEPVLAGHIPAGETLDLTSHALDLVSPVAMVSLLMLGIALCLHIFGWLRAGKQAYRASEIIHHLPILKSLYDASEARLFDGYEWGIKVIGAISKAGFRFLDRPIDFMYETVIVATGRFFIRILKWMHNGYYANYLAWCLAGLAAILLILNIR